MPVIAIVAVLQGALALAGHVACIDRAAGTGGAVFVHDVGSGAAVQVGPGRGDGAPQWSPDGVWLAFETDTDAGRGIYVVRADGTDGQYIPATGAWNTSPAWSTDGTRLVYCSAPERGGLPMLEVYALNTATVATWAAAAPGLVAPQWLPYTGLLFHLNPDQSLEVPGVNMGRFLAEAQMEEADLRAEVLPEAVLAIRLVPELVDKRITMRTAIVLATRSEVLPVLTLADPERAGREAVLWGAAANWVGAEREPDTAGGAFGAYTLTDSGETTRLAFESNEGGDREIMVLGKRGIANVSNHRSADWNPVWSPDGKVLAFESFRGGARGIYRVYTDTAHVTPLAADPGAARWSPAWSPDGRHVAYISDETGMPELFVTTVADGEVRQLTDGGGPREAPAWRPESL